MSQIFQQCIGSKNLFFLFLLQVDLSHIYGDNLDRQNKLRLFKDGKLRYQVGGAEDGRLLRGADGSGRPMTVSMATGVERRGVPAHCEGRRRLHALPSSRSRLAPLRCRPRGLRPGPRPHDVRHHLAAGTQPGVRRAEGGSPRLGRRKALPDHEAYSHRYDFYFTCPMFELLM